MTSSVLRARCRRPERRFRQVDPPDPIPGSARMRPRRTAMLRRTALALLFALLAALPAQNSQAQDVTLTAFAAASMKNAVDDINAAFTKSSNIKVVASYAASSALAKQIESGA